LLLLLALAQSAQADFSGTFNPVNGLIPDGSLVGWSDTRNVTGAGGAVTDVNVRLRSGGGVSTVTSWGLDIAAVPEPASLIEASVAVLFLGGTICLFRFKGKKVQLLAGA